MLASKFESNGDGLVLGEEALFPRVVAATGRTISFADGSKLDVDAVIWATGYRADHAWIDLPLLDSVGRPRHRRGVTDVPGLYFLGLSWQHTRGSALLGWVKDDAEFIATQIAAPQTQPSTPTTNRCDGPLATAVAREG